MKTNMRKNVTMTPWKYERFKNDAAIYGICQNCGFIYIAGSSLDDTGIFPYNFCPICGERHYMGGPGQSVTCAWEERDIEELYIIQEEATKKRPQYYQEVEDSNE